MPKVYFNTPTFDDCLKISSIETTATPPDADLLVLGAKKIDFTTFKNLKAVYRFGIGSENIDFDYLKNKNIQIHFPQESTKQILYDATANFAVYAILFMIYKDAFGKIDPWQKKQRDYLGHKSALVIGTGNIGNKVANKLKCFFKVCTYDMKYNSPEELNPLLQQADIITVHLPLDNNTLNFFDRTKLSWLKDDAIIVNTARGDLFKEDALHDKLVHTNCRAFFDVFWEEPYRGKLKDLGKDKFYMTPHSASNTKEFIHEGFKEILKIYEELA